MRYRLSSRNRLLTLLIFVAILLSVGVGIYFKASMQSIQNQSQRPPFSIIVETLKVIPETVENRISAVGSIFSNESVLIKPEVSGKINFIGFEEGEHVGKGKILFRLDSELLDAEYQEVKANYDYASLQYERAKRLKKDGVIPLEEFDERHRAFLNAKSRLNTLATRLRKYKIKAPFDGRVGARMVSIGDYVAVGDPLVHIEDLSLVKVEFYIPQRYMQKLKNGQLVNVLSSEIYPANIAIYKGKVVGVGDYSAEKEIDLNGMYKAGDLLDVLRARTFPPFPGAHFEVDGKRVYVRVELSYGPDLHGHPDEAS